MNPVKPTIFQSQVSVESTEPFRNHEAEGSEENVQMSVSSSDELDCSLLVPV